MVLHVHCLRIGHSDARKFINASHLQVMMKIELITSGSKFTAGDFWNPPLSIISSMDPVKIEASLVTSRTAILFHIWIRGLSWYSYLSVATLFFGENIRHIVFL